VVEDGNRVIYSHEAVVSFDIIDVQEKEAYMDREPGMVQPVLEWTTSQLGDLSATVE
jgi:hypothetical protein